MGIQFEEEDSFTRNRFNTSNNHQAGSKMADWLVKSNIVKDAATANIILTIVAIFAFLLSVYFFMYGFNLPQFNTPESATSPLESQLGPKETQSESQN